MAWPFPPVATMVPDITVLPLPACAGSALLVCAPTDNTRTGKSVPGGSAVPGFGAEVPVAAGVLVAWLAGAVPAGAGVVRLSVAP